MLYQTFGKILLACFLTGAVPAESFSLGREAEGTIAETGKKGPIATAESTSHDFGDIYGDKKVSHTFRITNTGDSELTILSVYSNCGCTTTDYNEGPLKPGESTPLTVTFDPKGRSAGYFTKLVRIKTNAAGTPTRLYIKGRIRTQPGKQ